MSDMWKSAPFGAVSQLYRCGRETCKNTFRVAYLESNYDCPQGFPTVTCCPACLGFAAQAIPQGVPLDQASGEASQKGRSPEPPAAKTVGRGGNRPDNVVPKKTTARYRVVSGTEPSGYYTSKLVKQERKGAGKAGKRLIKGMKRRGKKARFTDPQGWTG